MGIGPSWALTLYAIGATEEVVAGEEVAVSGEAEVVVKRVVASVVGADDASVVKLDVERIVKTDSVDAIEPVETMEEMVDSSYVSDDIASVIEVDKAIVDVGLLVSVDEDSVAAVVTAELLGLQGLAMQPSPSDNKM